ncbi:uncharacterized protein [Primulina eburnea]|uniref:uncharacterized protein n=1 Tax=Primulina eburnea TaxID=1245227 RepID=UPI003C6C5357
MWSKSENEKSVLFKLDCTNFRVIAETKNHVEISFTKTWNVASVKDNVLPLNIDKRFIMLTGVSGFYTYAIFEHLKGWPGLHIDEARIAFKPDKDLFHYMAISDNMQKIMPTEEDVKRGKTLDYKEAVILTNPTNPILKGQVDDKYQYSCENQENHVHGWISSQPHVGFWVITPSDEFRSGGPVKQDLTSHSGPTALAVFFSGHYASPEFRIKLHNGEPWKKVFGPIFIYLNSDSGNKPVTLWKDAKQQMMIETKKWPYDFPSSKDFPSARQRGSITGRLLVRDMYLNKKIHPAKSAYVGLATPGDVGSWQEDTKGYQFWTRTDAMGYFTIENVREGIYHLYGWVPGIIGDYKYDRMLIIKPGSKVKVGNIVYDPPRNGPTLWEIGIPDRSAAEFYVPHPNPRLVTHLFINNTEKFRQYGLWERYAVLNPTKDVVYRIGVSDYRKHWFFAHANRKTGKNMYKPTAWKIVFDLKNVIEKGTYTLRLALASASLAEIQVRINNPSAKRAEFTTKQIGRDNAIARHGIHGLYSLYSVKISGSRFVNGRNTIYLTQTRVQGPFNGVMYDYIRLEAPPPQ